MAAELGASRRTLFRDLQMLRDAGVPTLYNAKERTFGVEGSVFLPSLNLTVEEATALLVLTRRFIRPEFLPFFQAAHQAALKIEGHLPPDVRRRSEVVLQGVHIRWQPLVDAGRISEVFTRIRHALVERRRLELEYDSSYEVRSIQTVVSPYRLVFVSRAWYLLAPSAYHHGQIRTFKLDRIVKAELLREVFEPDPDFDVDEYFGFAWSMIPEGTRYHVRLRFLPKVAGNVEEVTWHKTQQVTFEPDGSCLFEVDVDGLGEITWWVLGYGDQVIVEEPPELRERIGRIAGNMCRLAGDFPVD